MVVLFVTLTGCAPAALLAGGDPSAEPAPTEQPVSAEESERARKRDSKEALRSAVANVVDSSIDFRYTLGDGSHTWERTDGTYSLDPEGWAATSRFVDVSDDDTTYTMHVTSTDGWLWMQMEQWPPPDKGCWLLLGPGQVPVGLLAMSPQQPGYVTVLDTLKPASWAQATTSGVMTVTIPLRHALGLLPARTVRFMGAKRVSMKGHLVYGRADIVDGRLMELHLTGGDIQDALRRAKGKLLPSRARHLFMTLRVSVSYPLDARTHDVERPPADLVITQEEAEAGQGCRGGQSL